MLSLTNIRKSFADRCLISDFSLSLQSFEALCIKGPSGIGKTTLLEIAANLCPPDAGTVKLATNRLACVFQDDALIPWLSAQENILLVLHGDETDNCDTAQYWLDRFDLPAEQPPTEMSGGMRRRLSLARAFASDPDILFLDEPFAFLDQDWQQTTAQIIEDFRARGGAVLMISHQLDYLHEIRGGITFFDKPPLTGEVKYR